MAKFTVYSTNYCPFCVAAKKLLQEKSADFEEINLSDKPDELVALKNRTGLRTVPQIFADDELIGGFDELNALNKKGELDKML